MCHTPPTGPCPRFFGNATQDPGDAWHFAELQGLVRYLEVAAHEGRFKPDPRIPFAVEPSRELCEQVLADYGQTQ